MVQALIGIGWHGELARFSIILTKASLYWLVQASGGIVILPGSLILTSLCWVMRVFIGMDWQRVA